ncbi:hypothetical protein CSA56_05950 [candidate division KSB3 bacterium]|uniref:Uncharacterized protein n=1 Tax=candidate division KSB3 bacterium TaxID=2044937 RepID=A0A2G6KI17_9BACT|nr:MAG: hypothetical protein CSA56_05950 [candidate division KSB3 bacterium]
MIRNQINDLEKKLTFLVKESSKRRKKAKKSKVKYYFEGQEDAFEQILIELKNLKYELDMSEDEEEEEQTIEKSTQEDIEGDGAESLLQQALKKGIITQRSSHYYYDEFPNKRLQGRGNVLAALSDTELYEKIQQQLSDGDSAV